MIGGWTLSDVLWLVQTARGIHGEHVEKGLGVLLGERLDMSQQ